MRKRSHRPYVLIIVLLLAGATAILLFTPLGQKPLERLFTVGDVEPVEFATLELSDNPNQYLVCPVGYCRAQAHGESPTFYAPVQNLRERWQMLLEGEPRVELLAAWGGLQFDYVQRSAQFRFPDIISVRFIPLASDRSTLAVYSRSVYGRSDFGVNEKRVEDWLQKLRERAAQER